MLSRTVPPLRTSIPYLTIAALIALLALAAPAGASLPAIDISGLHHELIRAPAEYLSTTEDSTLEEVRDRDFQPLTAASVNQGITGDTFWVRFRLDNTKGNDSVPWVLHHETSYLDHITLYYGNGDDILKEVSLSDRVPFGDRPLDYRTLAFPHETAAGGVTDLYVKMAYAPNKADSVDRKSVV